MRKKCRFAGLFLAGFSVFALAGCGNSNNGFTVTFNSNGGSSVEPFISYDGNVMEPTEPTKDGSLKNLKAVKKLLNLLILLKQDTNSVAGIQIVNLKTNLISTLQ